MAQYAEGQHLHGSDGRLYVVHNGVPVVASPTPLISSPTLPGELQAQQDTHAKSALDIQKTAGTLAADEITARAQAQSAGIKAKSDQIDLNVKTGTPPGDPSRTGAAYLATLPEGVRDLASAMLANRYPATINRNIPVVNQAVLAANHVNPAFDSTRYNMRVALMNKSLAGNDADELKAYNAAVTHAGVLYDQAAKLPGGADYGFAPLTHLLNAYQNWSNSTSPGLANFKDTAQKYGQEESKVYAVNTGGGQQENLANYNLNDPAKTIQSNIVNDLRLMTGRAAAILNKYNLGNAGQAPLEPLDPDARAVLQRLIPDVLHKQFATRPDPLAQAMGIPFPAAPGSPPPPPPGPGFAPPPTGPTNSGSSASTNGYSETPDPQSAQFWADAARQGTPYGDALKQWQHDVGTRGLVGITPPPQGAYQKAAAYIRDHPNVPYQPFSSITRTPVSPGQQAITDAAFSGPGVAIGHAANSLVANIPTGLAGDKGALYNDVSNATHPNWALGGDVLGTIGGALGTQGVLNGAVRAGKAAPVIGPTLKAMGLTGEDATRAALQRGLVADNLYGATSGAAQDPSDPSTGAALGMAAMTGGNLAGRYVLGPAIRATQAGANKFGGMFGAQPFQTAAPLDPALTAIMKQSNPAIDAIRGKLSQASDLGLPYALADADPRLQALTGSAVRKSPDVLALANQSLAPRQLGQAERAINLIDTHLAPSGDLAAIQADARTRAQAAAAPLYQKAMQAPVPRDPKLGEMLDTPAGQQAARHAYGIALNSGENPAELSFATAPDGSPIINADPNWKTLQYIKMGLDKVISDNQSPVTGKLDLSDPGNRALNELRARFVNRLGELNPDYRDANAAYSKIISQGSAAQRGYNATAPKVTPDQASIALTNQGENAPSFRQGYASSMADAVNNAQLSGNPYNRVYGTPNQQAKVNAIFPNAGKFDSAYNLENDMAGTAREALGGSQTAPRLEADRHFAEGNLLGTGADIAMSTAMGIPPVYALRRGAGFFARDMFRLGIGNAAKNKADAIGPMLLNTDPAAGLQTLDDIQKLSLLRQAYVNRTGAMGGMFAAPTIYGLTQQ